MVYLNLSLEVLEKESQNHLSLKLKEPNILGELINAQATNLSSKFSS